MNKKAFTLLELLLAISLLAMVLGLCFQIFTNEVDTAKKSAYNIQINKIIALAKDYHLQHLDINYVMVDDLLELGIIDNETVIDPRDGSNINGCIKITKDEYYNQYRYEYFILEDCTNN